MNNQDNKQTHLADRLGQLDHILRKIQDINSQLERIESRNTKARDGPRDYESWAVGLTLETTMRIAVLMIGMLLRKKK